jgi:hypothetical protein
MVGDEDIRLVGFQMFTPLHLNRQQESMGDDTSPPTTRIVTPIVAIANGTTHTHDEGRPNGHQDGDGKCHKQLIDAV